MAARPAVEETADERLDRLIAAAEEMRTGGLRPEFLPVKIVEALDVREAMIRDTMTVKLVVKELAMKWM